MMSDQGEDRKLQVNNASEGDVFPNDFKRSHPNNDR